MLREPVVVWASALAAIALVVLATWALPRARVLRALTVLAASLGACVSVGLLVNLPMGYVNDPSDLVRWISPAAPRGITVDNVGQPPRVGPADAGPQTPLPPLTDEEAPPATWRHTGDGLLMTTWTGPSSHVRGTVNVWTPRGFDGGSAEGTYLVLFFLHGFPGGPDGVADKLDAGRQLQRLIDAGKLPPTILVIPEANPGGREPSCADIPGGIAAQKWLSHDVVSLIRREFPSVSTHRGEWMISGASSGAYCAARSAYVHPEIWGGAGVMSGYDFPVVGPLGRAGGQVARANMLSTLAAAPRVYPTWLYVTGTRADVDSARFARRIVTVKPRMGDVVTAHVRATGGHNWTQWRREFVPFLEWWAQQLRSTDAHRTNTIEGDVPAAGDGDTPWGLLGKGTLIAAFGVAFLIWCAFLRPSANRRAAPGWVMRLTVVICMMVVSILPWLLWINRSQQFYTSLSELAGL